MTSNLKIHVTWNDMWCEMTCDMKWHATWHAWLDMIHDQLHDLLHDINWLDMLYGMNYKWLMKLYSPLCDLTSWGELKHWHSLFGWVSFHLSDGAILWEVEPNTTLFITDEMSTLISVCRNEGSGLILTYFGNIAQPLANYRLEGSGKVNR